MIEKKLKVNILITNYNIRIKSNLETIIRVSLHLRSKSTITEPLMDVLAVVTTMPVESMRIVGVVHGGNNNIINKKLTYVSRLIRRNNYAYKKTQDNNTNTFIFTNHKNQTKSTRYYQ